LSLWGNDVQSAIDQSYEKFKKGLEKQLGKMGLSLAYAALTGTDAYAKKGGVIVARFNDKEGHPKTQHTVGFSQDLHSIRYENQRP